MKKGIIIPATFLVGLCSVALTTHAQEEPKLEALDKVNWEVVSIVDEKGSTVTGENKDLVVRAKYDIKTNHYEFFDVKEDKSREEGTFFVTENTIKAGRIFSDKQQLTDIVKLDKTVFTYRTTGKQKDEKTGDVFVVSKPFTEKKLDFTNPVADEPIASSTIETTPKGSSILAKTVWQATKVVSSDDDDLTEYNKDLLNYAMFDDKTGRYEYFDIKTGKSTKDYGFFDVIRDNTEFVSINHNSSKHLVAKVKDLNQEHFTYSVQGKDQAGKKELVDVVFEPVKPSEKLEFTISEAQANKRPVMPTQKDDPTPPEKPGPGTDTSSSDSSGNTGSTSTDSNTNTSSGTNTTSTSSNTQEPTSSTDIDVPTAPDITQPYAGEKTLRGTAETNTKVKLKKSVFTTKPNSTKAEKKFVDLGVATVNSDGQWELNFADALAPGEEIEAIAVNIDRPEYESKPTYATVEEYGKGKGGDKPGGTNQHNKKPDGTNQNKKPDGKKLPQTGEAVKKTSLIVGVVIIVAVVISFYMKNKKEKN